MEAMERYANKRIMHRTGEGKFRAATMEDFGLGGVCPVCRHLLIKVYDGDPKDPHPDPRKFRNRCFTCEPETEAEKEAKRRQAENEPKFSIIDFFKVDEQPR